MSIFRKFLATMFAVICFGALTSQAHAALILAQLIDQNPPIRGLTYVDGVLIQDTVLADETYADRFTGFTLVDPSSIIVEPFNVTYNVYAPGGGELVGVLQLSGDENSPLVHTFYYSTFPGALLTPFDSPTGNIIADGNFHTVLEFATSNGDQYIFQYKNVLAEVPEPGTVFIFAAGLFGLAAIRRKSA